MNEVKTLVAKAPGRINIIGEHLDYNDGHVLPASIQLTTQFRFRINGTPSTVNFDAKNVNETYSFNLNDYAPIDGNWQNYVMGVVNELQKLGGQITGFDASFEGTVPIGSGMSSSAALECSLATGLNALFDLGFSKKQIINACINAEHNFVGIKCGVMDQFASMMGKQGQAMLLDCMTLEYEYVPLEMDEHHFLLLNTNVTHELSSSEYNKRRQQCEDGLAFIKEHFLEVKSFRDVKLDMVTSLIGKMNAVNYNRCHHVVMEEQRVMEAVQVLQANDLSRLGELMYDSHDSLSQLYEVSCPELDFLVDQTRSDKAILGSRMMGGGFGGCTINMVQKEQTEAIIKRISEAYRKQLGKELTAYVVETGPGAHVL